jgi:hypothetical protein
MAKAKLPKLSKSSIAKRLKNKEQVATTLDLWQIAALDDLVAPGGKRAGVPKSVLFREAVTEMLAKHGKGAK